MCDVPGLALAVQVLDKPASVGLLHVPVVVVDLQSVRRSEDGIQITDQPLIISMRLKVTPNRSRTLDFLGYFALFPNKL